MKTIYIAGPMRGHRCYNFQKFFSMAEKLEMCGFEVINPAEIDTLKMFDGWTYTSCQYPDILLKDIQLIKEKADAVVLLNGWHESPGATAEFSFADAVGIVTIMEASIAERAGAFPFEEKEAMREYIMEMIGEG